MTTPLTLRALPTQLTARSPEASGLPARITRQPPVTIDTFLTKQEFLSLVEHMGNGNPVSHFLTVWCDDDGTARFAKAKPHIKVLRVVHDGKRIKADLTIAAGAGFGDDALRQPSPQPGAASHVADV